MEAWGSSPLQLRLLMFLKQGCYPSEGILNPVPSTDLIVIGITFQGDVSCYCNKGWETGASTQGHYADL